MYRTLYCAENRRTCFLEIFDPLYPSLKTAQDLASKLGCTLAEALALGGSVSLDLLLSSAIVPARIEILSGDLVDLRKIETLRQLQLEHADLLLASGVARLDNSVARGPDRRITQTIGQALHAKGAAGVIYGSRIDDLACIALFEGRSRLLPDGPGEPLTGLLQELHGVFTELGLKLDP